MTVTEPSHMILPAVRGVMGYRVYYSCLMRLNEISSMVHYADEIHDSESLSAMIRQRLEQGQGVQIAEYLESEPRPGPLFNSLVVATYQGDIEWHELYDYESREEELKDLKKEDFSSLGFLILTGDEKLFVLDGQHRLAGIKNVIHGGLKQDPYYRAPVILIEHKNTPEGMERTRKLFVTLNKTTKSVSKGDAIALDEDDVMAITTRRLIEECDLFHDGNMVFSATDNIPAADTTSLTTIGNLYDILGILFSEADSQLRKEKLDLRLARPDDSELDKYFQYAVRYFEELRERFMELECFFSGKDTTAAVGKIRGAHGGSILFRPFGLALFTRVIAALTHEAHETHAEPLPESVRTASKLPRDLASPPYAGLIWDTSNRQLINAPSHRVTLRELLIRMAGGKSKFSDAELLRRYRRETRNKAARLPDPVV